MWGRCAGLAGGEEVVVVRVIVLELGEDVPEALRGGQNIEALKACDKRTAAVSKMSRRKNVCLPAMLLS